MSTSMDIPIHDIMPLAEVPEPSIYWFSALMVMISIVFASGIIRFLIWKRSQKKSHRKLHYEALQTIDLKKPKQSAYTITKEGYFFSQDTEETAKAYQNLVTRLEPYKYAPKVAEIDEETLKYYYDYLEMVNV